MKKLFLLIIILFFASNIPNNLFGQARKYVSNSTTGTTVDTIVFTQQVKSGTDTTTKKTGVASIQILSYGATTDTLKYWTDRYGFATDKGILVGKQKVEIIVKGTKMIDTLYLQGNATITRSITAGFIDEISIEDYSVLSGASTSAIQTTQQTSLDSTAARGLRIETKLLAGVGVTGTFWQGTQPISALTNDTITVIGTFWQGTQPISAASLPLPSGASTSAIQTTQQTSIDSVAGRELRIETKVSTAANQITEIARMDTMSARLLRLEDLTKTINSSALKGFKTGTVGTAYDSLNFSGNSNEIAIDFSLGAGSVDTLYVANNNAFTGVVLRIVGGRTFNWNLLYTSNIYFKANAIKPYSIVVR